MNKVKKQVGNSVYRRFKVLTELPYLHSLSFRDANVSVLGGANNRSAHAP